MVAHEFTESNQGGKVQVAASFGGLEPLIHCYVWTVMDSLQTF